MGIIGFFQEFIKLMEPMLILVMLGSTVLGVVIGALPGLTATMGIALLTGLTYKVPTVFTFTILIGVYVGAIYGGSISAIRVTRAASIVGTLIRVLALALLAPPLTKVALMFTSPEYFMLALFGVMICGTIVSSDLAINNRSFDLVIVFLFGVLGYFLDKMKYSPAPIVLGLILGNMIDENFRRTLIVSSGDPMLFLSRPISLIFFLVIVYTILHQVFSRKKPAGAAMAEIEATTIAETKQDGTSHDA